MTTTTMPLPPDCGCRSGRRLCLRAERLRGRLDVEFELATQTGIWTYHERTLELTRQHVAAMRL